MNSNYGSYSFFINHFSDYKSEFEYAKNLLTITKKNKSNSGAYTIVNVGMGCVVYLKYNFYSKSINGYFLHHDNYGQYGESTNHHKKALKFVQNFKYI